MARNTASRIIQKVRGEVSKMFGNIFNRKKASKEKKKKDKPVSEPKPVVEQKPVAEQKPEVKRESSNGRVPFFSRLSLTVIAIGLIVGLALGLGYWALSPSTVIEEEPTTQGAWDGFLTSLGIGPAPPTEPWMSEVKIQIVNPGSNLVTMGQLANIGVYYAAKAKSLPFLQYLSQDLAANSPMYNHTIDELDEIVTTQYDATSEQPTMLLQVTVPTAEEALFLTSRIPKVFQEFLVAEEMEQQQQTRNNILQAIEEVKTAIIEAEQEVSAFEAEGISGIENNPDYIALDTKISALELELIRQANILANLASQGNGDTSEDSLQKEYNAILFQIETVKQEVIAAQKEVNILTEQKATNNINNHPTYLKLTAEIAALENRINTIMNGGIDTVTGLPTMGLAEMITLGINSGSAYEDAKNKLDTASAALSNDKKQLAILESQINEEQLALSLDIKIAQADVIRLEGEFDALTQKLSELVFDDTTSDMQLNYERTSAALAKARQEMALLQSGFVGSQLPGDLDYQIAQARVDTLNNELTVLNDSLSDTFVNTGQASEAVESLAVGNPSVPEIVFPERIMARTALAIGAILGMIIAWAILNYRWIKKVFISSEEPTESQ